MKVMTYTSACLSVDSTGALHDAKRFSNIGFYPVLPTPSGGEIITVQFILIRKSNKCEQFRPLKTHDGKGSID